MQVQSVLGLMGATLVASLLSGGNALAVPAVAKSTGKFMLRCGVGFSSYCEIYSDYDGEYFYCEVHGVERVVAGTFLDTSTERGKMLLHRVLSAVEQDLPYTIHVRNNDCPLYFYRPSIYDVEVPARHDAATAIPQSEMETP